MESNNLMSCEFCKNTLIEKAKFCHQCGHPVSVNQIDVVDPHATLEELREMNKRSWEKAKICFPMP